METVRMNITLPYSLAEELKKMTAPRKRSRFVSDVIALKSISITTATTQI